ncbi:P-loop containing nucleoside triphosphate hydrolase protein [Lipomyces arxii]|uniref:P-loop containing nucleoside triphosphate hydrolase protein n=1 Tax=Lipomyces arxii TaxID=56418 RepID=UPI0034CDE306
MTGFVPRTVFPTHTLPRAYFIGHHAKAIRRMREMVTEIDLVFEVRDARAPLSTRNSIFESIIGEKPRVVVYTKSDISAIDPNIFKSWHSEGDYCLVNTRIPSSVNQLLNIAKKYSTGRESFFGLNTMIMGMPNVGKSSLLNTLRYSGTHRGKAAKTGAMAGVTRSIPSLVKISEEPAILVYDTPGVSLPTTIEPDTMLVLSCIGSTNTGLIDPVIQADFLLYQLNKMNPTGMLYSKYSKPTNEIEEFLTSYCRRMGRLGKGGHPDLSGAAAQWVDRSRKGLESKVVFDDYNNLNACKEWEEKLDAKKKLQHGPLSDQKFRVA